jgi:hypothetical protein
MAEQSTTMAAGLASAPGPADLYLTREYTAWRALYDAQPDVQQRFLDAQARGLAATLVQGRRAARFALPDYVVAGSAPGAAEGVPTLVPVDLREQRLGGLLERLTRADLGAAVRRRFVELEQSGDLAVAIAAGLLRYAAARQMLYGVLPAGRAVVYRTAEGEDLPTLPVGDGQGSALVAASDAIAEEGQEASGRGELQAPFVPAARGFFLPQWVVVDDMGRLLVNSVEEAEARLASMQQFMAVLQMAINLAPYFVADAEYQRKRYGMLGQLVNQGRALAAYETEAMIHAIQRRAAAGDLNRGLSLSVPYFDDQALALRTYDFLVIPAGRIMFLPALVARVAHAEQAKVAQDTRLNRTTRRHLLAELRSIERAFIRTINPSRPPVAAVHTGE